MISIIIPTLNEEKIIENTLLSLKKNFSLPHEIIVSDGRSTDKTVEIAKKFADKVLVHSGDYRQTIAEGRNVGAAAATGDFLVFLDADCSIKNPDTFFTQALHDFNDQKLVALCAWIGILPEHETLTDRIMTAFVNWTYQCLNNVLHKGAASGEFQMMRAHAFKALNGFNTTLVTNEDVEMFNRLSKIGKTRFDSNLMVYQTGRRVHKLGWPRLLWHWFLSTIWYTISKKSFFTEWTPIR